MPSLSLFSALCALLAGTAAVAAPVVARAPKLLTAWSPRASYPIPILEGGGGVVSDARGAHHLVVAGGYLSNSGLVATPAVYSLPAEGPRKWRRHADLPLPLTHVAQVAVGTRLYVVGGFAGDAPGWAVTDCLYFDFVRGAWARLPHLPAPRGGGGVAYDPARNALLYAGGAGRARDTGTGPDYGDAWMLYLGALRRGWVRKASMPNARNHMAGVSAAGRLFFLGGQHEGREASDNQATVQEYVADRDEWVPRQPLPVAVGHVSASVMPFWDGVLVVGGIADGRELQDSVRYYDLVADVWVFVGTYPRRVQSPVCGVVRRELCCATGEGKPGRGDSVLCAELSLPTEI